MSKRPRRRARTSRDNKEWGGSILEIRSGGKGCCQREYSLVFLHSGRASGLPQLTMRTGSPTTRLWISSRLAGFGRHYLARQRSSLSQWELVHVSGDRQCGFGSQRRLCQKVSIVCQIGSRQSLFLCPASRTLQTSTEPPS